MKLEVGRSTFAERARFTLRVAVLMLPIVGCGRSGIGFDPGGPDDAGVPIDGRPDLSVAMDLGVRVDGSVEVDAGSDDASSTALSLLPWPSSSGSRDDYGSHEIFAGGVGHLYTLKNEGSTISGAITISAGAQTQFQLDQDSTSNACRSGLTTLSPGQSCDFGVGFLPTEVGLQTASLVIDATPGGTLQANLTGVGLTDGYLLLKTSPPPPFGVVDVGATAIETLTLTNFGHAPSYPITISTDSVFSIVPGGTCIDGMPVPPGDCTFTVQFAPTDFGEVTGRLKVEYYKLNPFHNVVAFLTGIGRKTVRLTVTRVGRGILTVDGTACTTNPCVVEYQIIDGTRTATVVASPAKNFAFRGWSLDCSGTGACVIPMDQDRNVEATFVHK
jgi:hypothetical protein